MRKTLAAALLLAAPIAGADQYIKVHFGSDRCPEYTRIVGAEGKNRNRCLWNNKKQADGFCVPAAGSVKWRSTGTGSRDFTIHGLDAILVLNENCEPSEPKRTHSCEIRDGLPNQAHPYTIESAYKGTATRCVLDPRIIVNNNV